jgi:hypothetical protein
MTKQSNKSGPVTTVVAGAVALPKLLAVAAINKGIDDVIKAAGSLQIAIGEVGVQALMHLAAHGDIGPVNRLMVGLPKGVRRNALGSWMLAHGSLKVNMDAGTRKTAPIAFDKAKKTDALAAMQDPWYSHAPEKELSEVFDLQRAIHMILQRAKGKACLLNGKTLSPAEAVDRLKAIGALAGETFEGVVKAPPANRRAGEPGHVAEAAKAAVEASVGPAASSDKPMSKRQSNKAQPEPKLVAEAKV